jgi:hypothetical protein
MTKRKTEPKPLKAGGKSQGSSVSRSRSLNAGQNSGMPIIREDRQLHASREEPTCAKMTILEGGFETRLGLAR